VGRLLLLLAALAQGSPRELIEELHSDRAEVRERALRQLKELGKAAFPELELAAKDPDPEVAGRAKTALRVIAMRERLSPALRKAFPGVEDRLAGARASEFTGVFLLAVEREDLKPEHYESLAGPALRGASLEQLRPVLSHILIDRFVSAASEVAALLRHPDTSLALYAGEVLAALDRPLAKKVNLGLLQDANPNVRLCSIRRLIAIGDLDAVPKLEELLQDKEPDVRQWALTAFGMLGAESEVPRLLAALADPIESIQDAAADALMTLDPPGLAEKIRPLFLSPRESERLQAVRILAALHAEDAVPSILKQLPSTDSRMRKAVAWALADLGAPGCGGALVPLLADPVDEVRSAALWAVAVLRVKEAGADVAKLVVDQEPEVRAMACWAAARLELREAVPGLLKTLTEQEPDLAALAAGPLGILKVQEALPRLLELAKDEGPSGSASIAAAARLTELPPTGDLLSFLEMENGRFLWAFGPAVRRLRPPDLGPALIKRIENEAGDEDERQLAIDAVGEFRIAEAVPVLLKNLRNREADGLARGKAAQALARCGAKEALPEIIALARDTDLGFRSNLLSAMADYGSRDAVPELRKHLKDPDETVQIAAVQGLEQLGAKEALDDLIPLLPGREGDFRSRAGAWLCHAGRREGAEALLNSEAKQTPINALRRPGAWRKLEALRYARDLDGNVYEILERVAADAGLLLQWRWADDREPSVLLQHRIIHVEREYVSGAEVLEQLLGSFESIDADLVVEESVLRLVSSRAARRTFRNWLDSSK